MISLFKKSHVYVLMHKEIPVLSGEYSRSSHSFLSIDHVITPMHLPVGTTVNEKVSLKRINHWMHWRGIPGYRVGLAQLLSTLNVNDPLELLDKYYQLSLSDNYWIKEENDSTQWKSINFWHHSWDQDSFGRAMFSATRFEAPESALYTPNNALNGYHRKAWFQKSNGIYLYKGGTPFYQEEPVNEWLASEICRRLHLPHTPYSLTVYEDRLVSVCPSFCNEDTDLFTASDVLRTEDIPDGEFQLDYYQDILFRHGIKDASDRLDDLMLLDYLMLNADRHNQNLGILVDSNTMEWKATAPLFDTGTGLGALLKDNEVLDASHMNNCRLFNSHDFSHERLLSLISNPSRYDLSALNGIEQDYGNMLVKYQPVTSMSNKRINDLYKLLWKRTHGKQ